MCMNPIPRIFRQPTLAIVAHLDYEQTIVFRNSWSESSPYGSGRFGGEN